MNVINDQKGNKQNGSGDRTLIHKNIQQELNVEQGRRGEYVQHTLKNTFHVFNIETKYSQQNTEEPICTMVRTSIQGMKTPKTF